MHQKFIFHFLFEFMRILNLSWFLYIFAFFVQVIRNKDWGGRYERCRIFHLLTLPEFLFESTNHQVIWRFCHLEFEAPWESLLLLQSIYLDWEFWFLVLFVLVKWFMMVVINQCLGLICFLNSKLWFLLFYQIPTFDDQ